MIIYKTTNLTNNKIYVGQHHTSADDGYLGSGVILKKTIKKNGKEIFKRGTIWKRLKSPNFPSYKYT